jgi:TonB family protein
VKLPLLVSLVLHALAIALLLTIHAPELPRIHVRRVTPIVSPYRALATVIREPLVQPVRPLRTVARAFRVPDHLPQAAPPQFTTAVPDPPILGSPDVRLPESTSPLVEFPPPPVRRVVAVTGVFDGAIPSNQAAAHTEITTGNFGDASTAVGSRSSRPAGAAISFAAEIVSKPRPSYTEEARRLQIEGEVLLEVLFAASGEARVLRTIRGLGHGLDENAISAARAIQFRPAQLRGAPADSTAVVHIIFQLAY